MATDQRSARFRAAIQPTPGGGSYVIPGEADCRACHESGSTPVLGFSAITNAATGGPEQEPDSIEAVLANAAVAGRTIAALLARLLPRL